MKAPGIAILLGKGKPGKEDDEEAPASSKGGDDSLLGQAFDAVKDDDREGFIALMRQAIDEASMGDDEE